MVFFNGFRKCTYFYKFPHFFFFFVCDHSLLSYLRHSGGGDPAQRNTRRPIWNQEQGGVEGGRGPNIPLFSPYYVLQREVLKVMDEGTYPFRGCNSR
jgi:hypothetical protein